MTEPERKGHTPFAREMDSRDPIRGSVPQQRDQTVAEFSAFYKSFMPKLVGFLRFQGLTLPEAADVAQETMIEAYKQWPKIIHPETWARRVASRVWGRRIGATDREDTVPEVPESANVLTATNIEEWEQRHHILQLIDQLPSRQRQVLAWFLNGYSPAQIAIELKMEAAAVRSNLRHARRAMTALMKSGDRDE